MSLRLAPGSRGEGEAPKPPKPNIPLHPSARFSTALNNSESEMARFSPLAPACQAVFRTVVPRRCVPIRAAAAASVSESYNPRDNREPAAPAASTCAFHTPDFISLFQVRFELAGALVCASVKTGAISALLNRRKHNNNHRPAAICVRRRQAAHPVLSGHKKGTKSADYSRTPHFAAPHPFYI